MVADGGEDSFAAPGLANVFGLSGDGVGGDVAAVAVGVGRGDGFSVELGQENVGDGVMHGFGRVLEQVGEADVELALAQADGGVQRGETAKAYVERRDGALGQITHFEAHMDRFRPLVRQRWREDPGPGAGLWFDLGPHLIDLTLHLFGLPDAVLATFAALRPGSKTDDWAHVQFIYPHMRAILNATLLSSGGIPRMLLHGTQASWAKYGTDPQEKKLVEGVILPGTPAFGEDPDPGILLDGATGQRTEIPVPHADQIGYYIGVRDAIRGTAPIPVSPESAIAVMAILETTFASGKEGRILPLPLTEDERNAYKTREHPVPKAVPESR